MGFVWQTVWQDLYRRRRNFILVTAVAVIALCLLASVLVEFGRSNYQIYTVRKLMNKKLDYVRFEIIWNDEIGIFDYGETALAFSRRLKELYPDTYGYFMDFDVTFAEYQGESDEYGRQKVRYVDEEISDLCPLTDTEGNRVSLKQAGEEDGMLQVYVGYALRNQLPVGTVLTNEYTGSKMYVAGVLKEGSTWISAMLFSSMEAFDSLDDYILSPLDDTLLTDYFTNTFTSQYVKCDDEAEASAAIQNIRALAKEYDIILYCKTINGWIEEEKLENKEVLDAVGILTAFIVLIAVFAIGTASIADVYSRQYELGIMYIHGVSGFQIAASIFLENMLKLCIAGGIAVWYSGNGLTGDNAYIHSRMVVPLLWVFILAVGLLTTWFSYAAVKRRSMTDYTGGGYR